MQMTKTEREIKHLCFRIADSNPTGNPKSGGTHSSWSGGKANITHFSIILQNVLNKFELIYFARETHCMQFKSFQEFTVKSPKDKIRSTCYDFRIP